MKKLLVESTVSKDGWLHNESYSFGLGSASSELQLQVSSYKKVKH